MWRKSLGETYAVRIWCLSNSNGIRTHNHLVHKQTLNHLAKIFKWLSCAVSAYQYSVFDCILLSCDIRVSEWIYSLYSPECQGTSYSKPVLYLNFNFNGILTRTCLVRKGRLNQNDWAVLWKLIWTEHLIVCCYHHITYEFQSESTVYSCLNAKELLTSNRYHI